MSIWMILRGLGASSARDSTVVVLAGGDYAQGAVRKRALKRPGFLPRRPQPRVALLLRRQDDRHRLRMHASHLRVRIAGEECEDVRGDFAFLRLADAGPVGPKSREAGQRPALVRGEPNRHLLAVDGVVFGKGRERHQAAVLRNQPSL